MCVIPELACDLIGSTPLARHDTRRRCDATARVRAAEPVSEFVAGVPTQSLRPHMPKMVGAKADGCRHRMPAGRHSADAPDCETGALHIGKDLLSMPVDWSSAGVEACGGVLRRCDTLGHELSAMLDSKRSDSFGSNPSSPLAVRLFLTGRVRVA
jgi:hypothetical protein